VGKIRGVSASIGDVLRETREERGLTLVEVSDATKIRVRYLRALEAEEWDVMPAPAYARGFLRTYSTFLGLDADALVEEFRRGVEPAAAEARGTERAPPVAPPVGSGRRFGFGAVALLAALAVIAIIFVIGVVGGGGGGGSNGKQTAAHRHHHHHHKHHAPKPAPPPTQASIEVKPTGTVWVCLVDTSGRALINGETLSAGQSRGPFRAAGFELNLGNGQVQILANGKDIGVPGSPNPLGYRVSPDAVSTLATASRPSCT
jgi:transcriptional regulator with XRE-family HTH domain